MVFLVKDTAHGKVGSMSEEIVNDEGRARTLVAVRIQDVNKIPNLYVEPNCAPKSDALGKMDLIEVSGSIKDRKGFYSSQMALGGGKPPRVLSGLCQSPRV